MLDGEIDPAPVYNLVAGLICNEQGFQSGFLSAQVVRDRVGIQKPRGLHAELLGEMGLLER